MYKNLLLMTDAYKITQYPQYPQNTQNIYSYFESRGGKFPKTVFFGLQYLLKKYFSGQVVQKWMLSEADEIFKLHLGIDVFNRQGWQYILDAYDGYLPISIKAVPEGSVVDTSNVLITIENTDPNCYWLTNYLETLLVQLWYPCTVATQSYYMKQMLLKYLEQSGDPSLIDFKLHDFGFRGSTSLESAGIGGLAHLVNFKGTDTLAAISIARKYYYDEMVGFSIPASEHSTITSWGFENENKAMENMLDTFPDGTIACVSDSYNIYNACENIWGTQLRNKIINRNGTLVVRPDSGDPLEVLPKIHEILADKFGYTINKKGYKVLDPHIRIIQGDGINYESLEEILQHLTSKMWSIDNIAFGSGGGLLQQVNRDTCKFAFKCSSAIINGKEKDIFKEPITDPGKNSKRGRLKLLYNNGKFNTVSESTPGDNYLVEIFRNGQILHYTKFSEVRDGIYK